MKNSLSVLFYIKKNQPKKNGLCSVLVRITTENENVCFSSNIDVDPRTWSSELGRVKGRTQEATTYNRYIDDLRYSIVTKHDDLIQQGGSVTAKQVRDAVFNIEVKEDLNTLVSMFTKHNDDLKKLIGREVVKATYTRYIKVLDRLKLFLKDAKKVNDIPITDVNQMFIRDFEVYLKSNLKCTDNLTAKSLRQLKKIVSIAIDNGIVTGNPFANIKLRFTYEERSYLIQSEIDTLINKDFGMKRLEQVRDMFIFSCYTGLAYTDLAHLRAEDIRESFDGKLWVMIKRQKTNIPSNILLLDVPAAIIEKYKGQLPNGSLLPVISNQKMNAYLKEIATVCGINKVLTFHVARHTFSTSVTLANGVPIETVSKMLGHTNLKTTQIYARITNSKIGYDMEMLSNKLRDKAIAKSL